MRKLLRKAASFWNIPTHRKLLFLKVVRLSVYRGFLGLIGSPLAFSEKIIEMDSNQKRPSQDQMDEARDIAFAIQLGAIYIPWPNVCRHQSWQAIYLLNERKIPFKYQVGTRKSNSADGHSWVTVGDSFICGACEISEYHVINFSDRS